MRLSNYFLPTLRETPTDAKLPSHRLMLETGMIRKVAAGIYNYLPLGYKVLKKIERIVRGEMNDSGGQEIKLPIVQPATLWQESGRWEDFGPEMFKLQDRKDQFFTLGPTHEEVITDLIRDEVDSYKQLPLLLYQINDKFRDEIRPRYGVMRSREFYMKDAYSFHATNESLDRTYQEMYNCYARIFDRCQLDWVAVEAPSGVMGGSYSQEFMALSEHGGEEICVCDECGYAANVEIATFTATSSSTEKEKETKQVEKVKTPGKETVQEVAQLLNISPQKIVKTFIYDTTEGFFAVLVRGDHDLAENKLAQVLPRGSFEMVSSSTRIKEITGADFGSIGPVGLDIPIIADKALQPMKNFVVGANEDGYHLANVNWNRDIPHPKFEDLRKVRKGDRCPKCESKLCFQGGIEVGQIFKLGTKYSESLGARFHSPRGELEPIIMGCYGIGVSRIISAVIEQNHDENGILWPKTLTPFQAVIIVLKGEKEQPARIGSALYHHLTNDNFEILLDDREQSPGVKFNDAELVGIPVRVIVGPRGLQNDQIEIEMRTGGKQTVKIDKSLGKARNEIGKIINGAV